MSDIAFAAAACKLGRAIWTARVRAYDLACIDWDELDATTRHLYVNQAADVLKANRPPSSHDATPLMDAFASHTRRSFGVVR